MSVMKTVFSEGFRAFFGAAGLYAVFSLLVWELYLGIHASGGLVTGLPFGVPPHLWHGHEMIFGYATAALGGFLLTAVPNWTGARSAPQRFIALATGLWLAGRIAVWFAGYLPPVLVAVADLAFLPLLAFKIALQLVRRPKPQNMVFLAFITLIWVGNLLVHLEWTGLTGDTLATGMRAGLFGLCAMIAVLGGRVTPAFTRNAMKRAGVDEARWPVSHPAVERPAVLLVAAVPVLLLAQAPAALTGAVAVIAGLLQFARLATWAGRWTWNQPILWSLHLGIAFLGAGLVTWGLAALGYGSEVGALHILGIGAVGGMTLAVMSRAILGHSGRALVAPRPVAVAYALVAAAALIRWLGSELAGDLYFPLMLGAGALWIAGFTLFLTALGPIICTPRPPREQGAAA
nr:NnrS family protein [Pukyongiella litopenaei]